MEDFMQVSKEDFDKFIKEYPNKLDYDVTGICEPPLGSYNDVTTGKKWPECMVAKVMLYMGEDYFDNKPSEYFIPLSAFIKQQPATTHNQN